MAYVKLKQICELLNILWYITYFVIFRQRESEQIQSSKIKSIYNYFIKESYLNNALMRW